MRKGQVAIYLLMTLVGIFLLALLNADTFIVVRGKNRVQNAGDAATLAAARKQGSLLNEIGRLNLQHLLAGIDEDYAQCEEIVMLQRRLALLGPLEALKLADKAARKNGMEVRPEFEQILREHVMEVRTVYSGGGQVGDPYPEPYPGAWPEYAAAIENAIADGLATGPDNIEFFGAEGGHMLLNRDFYYAISGQNWCWFHFNAEDLLKSYGSWRDWSPLPTREESSFDNSEIFSLHVVALKGAICQLFDPSELVKLVEDFTDEKISEEDILASSIYTNRNQVWFMYEPGAWSQWFSGLHLADDEDSWDFPIVGEIREQYNVRGCASICRCIEDVTAFATDTESKVNWTAAAKPFGTLENEDGEEDLVTACKYLVLPSFTNVRLVPIDSVGGRNLATADYGWVTHVRHHLGDYLRRGPYASGCFYCLQLEAWEHASFRQHGIWWLKFHSDSCVRPTGGPGGSHGGTAHGH